MTIYQQSLILWFMSSPTNTTTTPAPCHDSWCYCAACVADRAAENARLEAEYEQLAGETYAEAAVRTERLLAAEADDTGLSVDDLAAVYK